MFRDAGQKLAKEFGRMLTPSVEQIEALSLGRAFH